MAYVSFYHFSYKYKAKGYAKAHAQYICREGKYSKLKDGEELIAVKSGNMPKWAEDSPIKFFEATDKYERSNAKAYREFELAISNKLSREEQIKLIDTFVAKELGVNHPYLYAIHDKDAALDNTQRQTHAHIMFSERKLDGLDRTPSKFFKKGNTKDPHKGGCAKDRIWQSKSKLFALRKSWEKHQNEFFKMKNMDDRVDCRQLIDIQKDALIQGDDEKASIFNRVATKRISPKILQLDTIEFISNIEIFEKLENLLEARENKQMLDEIHQARTRAEIDVKSIMTAAKAKVVLKNFYKQNKAMRDQTIEYLRAIKYRQNSVNRQYATRGVQNAIYSKFSDEFKENKKKVNNLERQERELMKIITDAKKNNTHVDESVQNKLSEIQEEKVALLKYREEIMQKINKSVGEDRLKHARNQYIGKLDLLADKLEMKTKQLEEKLMLLNLEMNDIKKANKELWDVSKNRLMRLNRFNFQSRNGNGDRATIGKNYGYVEMGATGTRLQVRLYDERELQR